MYAVRKFDLSILEEGEEYVTDITVVSASLFPMEVGNDEVSMKRISKLLENGKDNEGWVRKGRLRLGTRSLIFEPNIITYPLLKFKFNLINIFKECEKHENYKQFVSNNCIFLSLPQVITIPMGICNGKTRCISPYQTYKVKNPGNNFIFFILFTNQQTRNNFLINLKNAQNGSFVNKLMDKTKFNKMSIENLDCIKLGLTETIWAWRIKNMVRQRGMIAIGDNCIYFEPCPNFSNKSCKKIYLRNIIYIFKRQCSMEPSGLEIISLDEEGNKDYRCLFLEFTKSHQRDVVLHHLKGLIPQAQESNEYLKVMQNYWLNGRISNFHYLDFLNCIGGRSRSDLSQYPVFPWILSNYTTSKLDLSDISNYRDLSKPIGALNDQRLRALILRMQEFKIDNLASMGTACHDISDYDCEGCMKRLWECGYYLYGSHYSSMALVVHLLIRIMPECHLRLYEGNFDTWNRCFHSIGDTFSGIINDHNCFYELIPDMFQGSDDFLLNNLNIETGQGRLDNVVLPQWANSNARTFLSIHRKALESDYVSLNLSKWIDLIFGFKQSGYKAVKNHNVFHPFTYLNNIRNSHSVGSFEGINYTCALKALIETMDHHAIKVQANEFGQIPLQLFTDPHPERHVFPQFDSNDELQYKPWFIYINSNMDKFPELNSEQVESVFPIIEPSKSIQCRRFNSYKTIELNKSLLDNVTSIINNNENYIFTHLDGSISHIDYNNIPKKYYISNYSIMCSCNISDSVTAFGTYGGGIIFISVPRLFQLDGDGFELPAPHHNFDTGIHSINITTSLDSIMTLLNYNDNLIMSSLDESIYLLSLKGLKISGNFDGLNGPANSISICDSLLLACNNNNNNNSTICLWDTRMRPSYLWRYFSKSIKSVGISSNYIASLNSNGEFNYWDLRMLRSTGYFRGDLYNHEIANYYKTPITHYNGIICPDNSDSILFITCDSLSRINLSVFNFPDSSFDVMVSINPADPSRGILHDPRMISYSNSLSSADLDNGILYSFY